MDYNDVYGYGGYEEPQRRSVQQQPKKPAGCMGCLIAGILMLILFMFLIGGVVFVVFGMFANTAIGYIDENEEVVESYLDEHEDEIIDMMDDMEDFMNGLGDAFEGDIDSDGE